MVQTVPIDRERLLTAAVGFFYNQRCGCALSKERAGRYAHGACHTSKARIYGTDQYIDVTGGWHDAGDYGRYIVPASKAVCDLMLACRARASLGADPELIAEIRYELEWMLKMQRSDGAVYHKVTCSKFCGFIPPDEETEELIVAPISTAATADFAGSMAMAYTFYRERDRAFAETCLRAAVRADAFLSGHEPISFHNPDGIATGEYDDENDEDERFFAVAALYAATGKREYGDAAQAYGATEFVMDLGWEDMAGYAWLALLETDLRPAAERRLLSWADTLLERCREDPYGLSLDNQFRWGSNMYLCNNAVFLCLASRLSGQERCRAAARRHLSYLLGDNPLGQCYVSGFGLQSPKHPHHRPSAAVGAAMPGMLAGGPDGGLHDPCAAKLLQGREPICCYVDELDSYSTNEVAIYWNSALVLLLAVL